MTALIVFTRNTDVFSKSFEEAAGLVCVRLLARCAFAVANVMTWEWPSYKSNLQDKIQ